MFLSLQFREDVGCDDMLMVASYEPNEVNFFTELTPLDASSVIVAGVLSLQTAVKDIIAPLLEPSSEVRSTLASRFVGMVPKFILICSL